MNEKPTFKDIFDPNTTPRDYGDHAGKVAQLRRLAVLAGGVAAVASTFFVGNELTKERVVDEQSVTVENGSQPGPEVCEAATALADKHGQQLNTDACLADLKDITLPDGTKVELAFTREYIGTVGNSIAFDVANVHTSIDEKIREARQQG